MNLTVHKYTVPVTDRRYPIELSHPGEITHVVALVPHELTFWAVVDTDAPKNERYFTVVGTGHPLPSDALSVVGSAPVPGVPLVWHLVETIFAEDPGASDA